MKRTNIIALVLIAVMISVVGATGVTTAANGGAKYQTSIAMSLLAGTTKNSAWVNGRLLYRHHVTRIAPGDILLQGFSRGSGTKLVLTPMRNRWVTLYYKECRWVQIRPNAWGKAINCPSSSHWHYWTKVRTDSKGWFNSPARTFKPGVVAQAIFPGDATFGACASFPCV